MLKPYKYKPSGKLTQTLAVVGVGRLVKPKKKYGDFQGQTVNLPGGKSWDKPPVNRCRIIS